jgi:hypothetical protein
VARITILKRGCPVCGSNQLRSSVNTRDHGRLLRCDNWDHPHWVLLDGEVTSLRDRAVGGNYHVMFYFTFRGHFEIPGYHRVFDQTPPVVLPWMTRSYGLDQARAAAKAVLLSRGPSPIGLDDVTDVVIRLMRGLRLFGSSHDDCAQVILAVCREIGIVGAGWRVVATSERLLTDASPHFRVAAE